MKILAPINSLKDVKGVIDAGADEIFCGVLSHDWLQRYTNVASLNRREWKAANLSSFSELQKIVEIAHDNNILINLALNALYTKKQYSLIFEQIEQFISAGVDALIVADLGLLLSLKKRKIDIGIHISTGGTTFNSQTAKFYEEFGISRIILPRHLQIQEIERITKNCPGIKFEAFILNSGCKNIDGFCTFQHGVNEIIHPKAWDLPKRLNFDRHLLNIIRRLPPKLSRNIKAGVFGIDSACLLNYDVSFDVAANVGKKTSKKILNNISSNFNLLSGVDACGACRLSELKNAGIYAVKIVGRNYSTEKKIQDTRFIKTVLTHIEEHNLTRNEFMVFTRNAFRQVYKMKCAHLCYYPDGM